ncbi:hypothetical protein F3Y22_tig00110163pilonHSYRG00062 [Hibiscus syriacus]|uniref:Uroporphyrinogen-III synthase n=1 Tax=Hibiscus syriacus TaxID=106335 RepID=A0A6A3BH67_HIBSY|nr:hypothetical protein F3Y22_tig00110163pilonHSYRG00062 [Hibiscus syriacus]
MSIQVFCLFTRISLLKSLPVDGGPPSTGAFSFLFWQKDKWRIAQFLESYGFLDYLESGLGSDENSDNLLDKLQDALGRGQNPFLKLSWRRPYLHRLLLLHLLQFEDVLLLSLSSASSLSVLTWVNLISEPDSWSNAVVCIGEITASAAKRLGLRNVYFPMQPGLDG